MLLQSLITLAPLMAQEADTGSGLYGASQAVPERTQVEIEGLGFGACADESGPIGGGPGYSQVPASRDWIAADLKGLLEALQQAESGQTIYLPGETVIDCSELFQGAERPLILNAGVTLASDRGVGGSLGALLFSDELKTRPLIRVDGAGARISGLRLRGPDPDRRLEHHHRTLVIEKNRDLYYQLPTSDGVICEADDLTVDNCELAGWSHAAVFLRRGTGHEVRHSFIHHNQRQGLGYGVCLDVAQVLIERNLFDWNRHSIAGTGRPGSGYEARHNVERGVSLSHLFDMHGGRDRRDGTDIAGTWINIHHNAFLCSKLAVKIRGVPERLALVEANWFVHESASSAIVGEKRLHIGHNAYGPQPARVQVGADK